ncbi:Cytochrome c [Pirellula sp. SH-Sr6A]|nr:Cytochrome c [Pirellula sp. SH-Sr6A]
MWIACTYACMSALVRAGDPSLPGHHPLTQSQAGSVLISELRCAACHSGAPDSSLPEKTAPDLSQVGGRIRPEYLRRFLESPRSAHPGTTMPDLLASKPESDRRKIAEALTHFLVAQSKPIAAKASTANPDKESGKSLFHSVGCVACHGPQDAELAENPNRNLPEEEEDEEEDPVLAARKKIKPNAFPLGHVAQKYSLKSLQAFLFQPLLVRSSGRMPDMKLTEDEAMAIASYLTAEKEESDALLVPSASLVTAGKEYFQSLRCTACHALPNMEPSDLVGSLQSADLSEGCLSTSRDGSTMKQIPLFGLTSEQRTAMVAALRDKGPVDTEQIAIAKNLTAFRCIDCHVRDGYGGVHDAHNGFFKGSELNLGDDGRIPPPLTLVGAKLQPAWMKKVLFDGESVRSYMSTRMPQYGDRNLSHLPGLFRRVDMLDGPELKIPKPENREESEREKEKIVRAAGCELLGDKGANCVACHRFNGKAANVNQGIDLLTSYERLQPEWFYRYVKNPGSFRPRTVMPTAWPDGKAIYTHILDGDTDRQIEAIWYYLSLGTSAADPSGVRAQNTKLQVNDVAQIHRGRSRIAGFRGIAVGLPEKIHYAFNAETGTLSAIWTGDFVNVNWSGQGSGDFNPASEPIAFAQDVSFASLSDAKASWPSLPLMSKETPTNPDPLYPKNVGYQFRGYFLDEAFIPTFQYRSGNIRIDDRSHAISNEDKLVLHRVMQFESESPQTIWFRVWAGPLERESDSVFRNEQIRITIPEVETVMRGDSSQLSRQELLLRLKIPQGKSTLEIQYEPIKK